MAGPLEGIRVIDWTQWQVGPVSTAMLCDLGATVIHVEHRVQGDAARGLSRGAGLNFLLGHGKNAYFETNNRGKKSLTVDLSKEKGKEIIYRLVKNSDVFVHNFRQGVPEKLGLDYETLSKYNPMLVYAASSGYGPNGPDATLPCLDLVGQARAGFGTTISEPDKPRLLLASGISDQTGAIFTAYGVLAALVARERFGVGQKVDTSILGSMMTLQGLAISWMLYCGKEIEIERREKALNPLWSYYECKDHKWLALGMNQSDRYWPFACKALGIQHLEHDPRFNSGENRETNCRELIPLLDEVFITRDRAEWMRVLKESGGTIFAPVNTTSDLIDDPQVIANNYIIECNHEVLGPVKVPGIPVRFSKTPGEVKCEAPEFGQHTEEVLIEMCGYSWDDILELKTEEVI